MGRKDKNKLSASASAQSPLIPKPEEMDTSTVDAAAGPNHSHVNPVWPSTTNIQTGADLQARLVALEKQCNAQHTLISKLNMEIISLKEKMGKEITRLGIEINGTLAGLDEQDMMVRDIGKENLEIMGEFDDFKKTKVRFERFNENIDYISDVASDLKDKITKLECMPTSNIEKVKSSRKASINDRETNIVIHGLDFTWKDKRDAKLRVHKFLDETLSVLTDMESLQVIPLGNRSVNKNVPLLVKFQFMQTKLNVYRNCHKLKGSAITIVDDLTFIQRRNRKLLMPTLKQLKSEGMKVSFRGDVLYANGKPYVA